MEAFSRSFSQLTPSAGAKEIELLVQDGIGISAGYCQEFLMELREQPTQGLYYLTAHRLIWVADDVGNSRAAPRRVRCQISFGPLEVKGLNRGETRTQTRRRCHSPPRPKHTTQNMDKYCCKCGSV